MMKRLVTSAAVLIALTNVMFASPGSAATGGDRTFRLYERNREEAFSLVDNPPRTLEQNRLSPGDTAALHQPLRSRTGDQVGAVDVACTVTRGGSFANARFMCHGGYKLKRGMIAVEVRFQSGRRLIFAITGGTGIYEGATGSIRQIDRRHGSVQVVHLLG
jgi:hypothetical protein